MTNLILGTTSIFCYQVIRNHFWLATTGMWCR